MSKKGILWLVVAGLALLSLAASAVGLWPSRSSPAPARADLRARLRARHAGDRTLQSGQADEGPDALQLTAEWLCGEPRAGEVSSLLLAGTDALAVPCGDSLDVWAVSVAPPVRLARITWPSAGLLAGRAAAADLDSDGLVDLLWVLRAEDPRQQHREGLYWARGRAEGGYQPPRVLVDGRVVAFASAAGEPNLWVAVVEPDPEARHSVWHVQGGASPSRTGRWDVPGDILDLALVSPHGESDVLLALGERALWSKDVAGGDFAETGLSFTDARRFVELDATVHLALASGLARLSLEGKLPSLGEARGPLAPEAAAGLASGQRLACARGALFSWRAGEPPSVLGAVGGGRIEGLVQQRQAVWLWLSGLTGSAGSGVVRVVDPWPPSGPVQLVVRRPEDGDFQAILRVP